MKIAVIMSGIIKNYDHLVDLAKIFNSRARHDFKVFGMCFDFLGNPKKSRDQISYTENEPIDTEFVSNYYTDIKYTDGNDFSKYDSDGFSNRIISQWANIKEGLLLAEQYENQETEQFDMIIRARPDISIVEHLLMEIIDLAQEDQKIYWRSDCVIVGVADRMKQILRLSDHYYEYHELPMFKQKTLEWLAKNIKGNRVRSNAESERLLDYHIINLFGRDGLCKYHTQFNEILRS
jgi:hypothetical protein|tara:strand:- start:238 stop:942 length:705 start_codon:yes stop_codon:yes gene_type:complete